MTIDNIVLTEKEHAIELIRQLTYGTNWKQTYDRDYCIYCNKEQPGFNECELNEHQWPCICQVGEHNAGCPYREAVDFLRRFPKGSTEHHSGADIGPWVEVKVNTDG